MRHGKVSGDGEAKTRAASLCRFERLKQRLACVIADAGAIIENVDDAQMTGPPDINLQAGCASNACIARQTQQDVEQDISIRKNLGWSLIYNLQSVGDFQLIRYLIHQDETRRGEVPHQDSQASTGRDSLPVPVTGRHVVPNAHFRVVRRHQGIGHQCCRTEDIADVMVDFRNGLTDVRKSFALTKGDQCVALHLLDGFCRLVEFTRFCDIGRQRPGNRWVRAEAVDCFDQRMKWL